MKLTVMIIVIPQLIRKNSMVTFLRIVTFRDVIADNPITVFSSL